jgi:hypothetical protein
VRVAARRTRASTHIPGQLAVGALLVIVAVGLSASLSGVWGAQLNRVGLAALITTVLVMVALRNPSLGSVLTLAFLVVLGLVRRLLIPLIGWSSFDPLLVIGPTVSLALVGRLVLFQRRPLAADWVSKAVVALVAVSVVEIFNPLGGGPVAGAIGLLFVGAPLAWFFIGREVTGRSALLAVAWGTVALGVAVGLYGLAQSYIGFPTWDQAWIDLTGYKALNVRSAIRGFGTFASASEYMYFLAIALVIAVAAVLHGRIWALLPIPILAVAILYASGRGVLIAALVAIVALAGLRARRLPLMVAIWLVAGAGALGGWYALGGAAETAAIQSGDPFVIHQVGGLTDPLNPDQSTLTLHWQTVIAGASYAVHNPLGAGTATSNLASVKTGGTGFGTEVDVIDEFIDLGFLGGALFILVIAAVLAGVVRAYLRTHDVAAFCVVGVLIVGLGHWLTGGHYAVAPLIWFLAGWGYQRSLTSSVGEVHQGAMARKISPWPGARC